MVDFGEAGRAAVMGAKISALERTVARLETRRECAGCLGYLVTKAMARDHGILTVTALVRPLEYFDPQNGGIVDTVEFFNVRRNSR